MFIKNFNDILLKQLLILITYNSQTEQNFNNIEQYSTSTINNLHIHKI